MNFEENKKHWRTAGIRTDSLQCFLLYKSTYCAPGLTCIGDPVVGAGLVCVFGDT